MSAAPLVDGAEIERFVVANETYIDKADRDSEVSPTMRSQLRPTVMDSEDGEQRGQTQRL